jgi:transcriptional regulator with XRE-family HTH domain
MEMSHYQEKLSVGQVLARIRESFGLNKQTVGQTMGMSGTTYQKIECDERELSFIMALRLCRFYQMDIHQLVALIDDDELERRDLSIIRMEAKRAQKAAIKTGKLDIS